MRQLSLHASALNDEEYNIYTTSLTDLDDSEQDPASTNKNVTHDDAYYERMKIGVREVRGWMRGRYANVPPANIDAILRFFSPGLSQADTLSGGEFFAALRLIVHVENGRDVDRGLAFVQAHPTSSTPARQASPERVAPSHVPASSRTSEPLRHHNNPFTQQHPPDEPSPKPHGPHNPFVNRSTKPQLIADEPTSQTKLPPLPPRKPPPPPPPHVLPTQSQSPVLLPPPKHNSTLNPTTKAGHVTSTLMKQSLQASKAAQTMKRAESQLEQERVLQVLKSSSVVSGASIQNRSNTNASAHTNPNNSFITNTNPNPNLNRSPSPAARHGPRGYGSSVDSGSSASASEAPPLPRRRAQTQNQTPSRGRSQQQPSPPVSVSSLEQVALASSSPARSSRPLSTSTNPYHRGATLPIASNTTSTLVTSTLYSSPHGSSTSLGTPGRPPPTHPDRKPYLTHSQSSHTHTQTSTYTYDEPDQTQNPSQDITVPDSLHGPGSAPTTANTTTTMSSYTTASAVSPFQTPDNSPTTRVFRSKSLHHAPPPPPPPARRRRPESAQVRGNVFGGGTDGGEGAGAVGGEVGDDEGGIDTDRPGSTLSRYTSLSMPAHTPNASLGVHRRSSLSLSATSSSHTARTSYSQPAPSHSHYYTHERSESPFSHIFATLQPKLDKARYKAEAGLSRRGFVSVPVGGGGGVDGSGSGEGKGEGEGRRGRVGRASSVLSGEEREEREELVGHRGYGYGYGYDAPGMNTNGISRRGAGVDGGGGSLNGVGGEAVLESDDTGDGEEGEGAWRREVKERWGAEVMDKDGLKLPAGEGWRPL